MTLLIAIRPDTATPETSVDELRSQMYADREFMKAMRRGYMLGCDGEGINFEEYFSRRGID